MPLVDPVIEVLQRRYHSHIVPHPDLLLFPAPDGRTPVDIRTAWHTAITKARIENFHFHDLRHTTASYLRLNDHSLGDIVDVLGHKSLAVTRRYAHLYDAYQRKMLSSTMGAVLGEGSRV